MGTLAEPPSVQLYQLLLVLLLVVVNGFFVGSEIAVVKTRISNLETYNTNSYLAKLIVGKALYFNRHMDSFLAAVQVGITVASLALGWVGEGVFNQIFAELFAYFNWGVSASIQTTLSVGCAFALITTLHIVLGEMVPKVIALANPLRVTLAITLPMWLCYWLFVPFVWVLNLVVKMFIRLFAIKIERNSDSLYSEEELKMIISDSHVAGEIGKTEHELIENVFEFDECEVQDIYTPEKEIKAIDAGANLFQALNFALQHRHSRYPVYAEWRDNIIGTVNTKDLMKLYLNSKDKNASIRPLIRQPLFVLESTKVYSLLQKMQKAHIQMAMVTDERGEVIGMVTFEDIASELVGDIQEDAEEDIVTVTDDGAFLVQAHNSLVQINKLLPRKIPEDDQYSTLSGYISFLYPDGEFKVRDEIRLAAYRGLILQMHRNTVQSIKLVLTDEPQPTES